MVEGGDDVVKVLLVDSSRKFSTTGPEKLPMIQWNLGAQARFPWHRFIDLHWWCVLWLCSAEEQTQT